MGFRGIVFIFWFLIDDSPDYTEIGYGIDAGPGAFSISYGEYDDKGENALIGYDLGLGDFTLGFYFYDFQADAASGMSDDDGAYFSISY